MIVRCVCLTALAVIFSVVSSTLTPVLAQTSQDAGPAVTKAVEAPAERQAFDAAKELGTVEAWDAFLKNYPNGFHADLARAYVKKLAGPDTAPATRATPTLAPPRVDAAVNVMTVTRVRYDGGTYQKTGGDRWIEQRDSNRDDIRYTEIARSKDGIQLQANDDDVILTLDVLGRIVWRQAGSAQPLKLRDIVEATSDPVDAAAERSSPPPVVQKKDYKPVSKPAKVYTKPTKAPVKTVTKSCGPNETLRKGKCVWKTDKNGYEISPEKKPGCSTWLAQCNKGNGAACGKHESTCQVN